MKLGIWSSYYFTLSPEDMLCQFAKDGIKYIELSDEHAQVLLQRGEPEKVGREFKEYAKKVGVKIPQGHLQLYAKLVASPDGVEVLKRWIDLFRAIGIKRGVLHCDGLVGQGLSQKEVIKRNVEKLKELKDYLKGTDFIICLENLPPVCEITPSVDDLLSIIKKVGGRNFGICLDTGHLNIAGGNQREFILKAGKKLKALHIADNEGFSDQHMMPFGKGNVDIMEVAKALKEIGYKDLYNLEIPGEGRCPIEVKGYKAKYIKQCFNYIEKNI